MLAEQNIECQVLESRQSFDGPTSGVRISADGVGVLTSIGVNSIGEATERVDMRFGGLSASFAVPATDASAIVVTRLALHEQLTSRARSLGIRVATGFNVAGMTELADGVEVTSDLNEEVTGTLLVGADGVGSTLRRLLNPEQMSTKVYAGYLGVGLITKDESKIEMTLHSYPGHQVGIASCGKVNAAAITKSIFMWTHIRMSEGDAKVATRATVESELAKRARRWTPELRRKYDLYTKDADAILVHGPVYNGQPPQRWYSRRMILCGDAAHPYGPGGQGISMALKDAKALCDVIARGFTEDQKQEFRRTRAQEARTFGESAEKRNAKAGPFTMLGVLAGGVLMKAVEVFNRGTLKM
jgi:2-polyprenyl-6-methoxyphenol hydroxylase-like FAD-dependent oxidoreductase